ncbi:EXLDI protein [Nocardia sp. NBC_01327]|uniref:EXLDI protein n=1 Tax=Nocardia sp. NBC_01327 TaxID=2903593 RepID=UPI002E130776|nr:EXLDI protein [Nocardia sp. NBC_01327]
MDIDMQKPADDDAAPGTAVTQTLPDDMLEIEVRVGPGGTRTQSFVGRLLAKSQQVTTAGAENVRIYQSRKGKLVVHRHYLDWSDFSTATKHAYEGTKDQFNAKREEFAAARRNADGSHVPLIANWAGEFKHWRELVGIGQDGYGDYTLEIVDSLGELRDRVPAKAYRTVADAVENPSAQFLDI